MTAKRPLTELQLSILKVLWDRRSATVAEVHDAVRRERAVSESTVAKILSRLEARGVVTHTREGRQYRFRAVLAPRAAQAALAADLGGRARHLPVSFPALVASLLGATSPTADDLASARRLLDEARARLRPDARRRS